MCADGNNIQRFNVALASCMRLVCLVLISSCLMLTCARAQEQQPSPSPKPTPDDVLRVNADLVQTDVVVLDKGRRFVDGLTHRDFILSIDGRPQPIAFF